MLGGRAPPTPAEPMGLPHETLTPAERPHAAHGPPAEVPEVPARQAPPEATSDAPIRWTPPASWVSQPSSSSMRLATYKVTDATELSVIRAGGLDGSQNINRAGLGQFDGAPKPDRSTRKVHGLDVTVVHLAGTYTSGGMMMGPAEKHDGWAMLAAIVEAGGPSYFFKLVGPSAEVDKARAWLRCTRREPHLERTRRGRPLRCQRRLFGRRRLVTSRRARRLHGEHPTA